MLLESWKMGRFAGWMLGFAICGAGLLSAAELGDARATVDEVVVDTSFLIPLTRQPIPFENFRYPYIDAQGTVTFVGNDYMTFGATENSGIYQSSPDGTLKALVKQEQISPDDGQPVGIIMGLQTDFSSISFHRGRQQGTGIYGFFDGGPLVKVASTRTQVPGKVDFFKWFEYSDVCDGRVVFNAKHDKGGVEIQGLYGYRHADRKLWRLLDTTQPVPAAEGARLANLAYQPRLDRSWLVFSANKADGKGAVLPGRGILGWALAGPSAAKEKDEQKTELARLLVLAPFGMEIPESGGRKMTSAPNPVTDGGLIATMAGSDPEGGDDEYAPYQALCVRTADGVWHNPLDTETVIPGRKDGATFTGINKWVAVADGQVIFRVYGPEKYEAVYLYEVAKDVLYFVADTTRQIDGKDVVGYETSTHPLAGQRLAMMVRFQDGTSGEYLATLPGFPVKAKRKGAAGE